MTIPVLPSHDPELAARQARIAAARTSLAYNYNRFTGVGLASAVPKEDAPHAGWFALVADVLVKIAINAGEVQGKLSRLHPDHPHSSVLLEVIRSAEKGGMHAVFDELATLAEGGEDKGTASALKDFDALFASSPLPTKATRFQFDSEFARMRVAGPNPMMLKRVTRLPENFAVTSADVRRALAHYEGLKLDVQGGELENALAEGRAFVTDYAALDGAAAGNWKGAQKFVYAPLALFVTAGADRILYPVAIQCAQKPGLDAPILTPADGYRWMMAKTVVQVADGNLHQSVFHLGRTHLVLESAVLAARRSLATNHPVSRLLEPHFEGTLYINDAADTKLTGPGGGVEAVMTVKIDVARAAAEAAARDWSFTGSMLRTELASRGVDDTDALPDYAFRDDALLIFDAIHDWVESFVRVYYKDAAAVRGDVELQAMFREMAASDGGRLRDVPAIHDIKSLTTALTHIIFTASAQHAAVNFPQLQEMSYAPGFPLGGYAPPPGANATERDWLAMLPPIGLAHYQSTLGIMLGSVRYTELGAYPHEPIIKPFAGDGRLHDHLAGFQSRLKAIESLIAQRNLSRVPYTFLMPSQIPQSINI